MERASPDVNRGKVLEFLRTVIRLLRFLSIKIKLREKIKVGHNVSFGPNSILMIPENITIGDNFSCGANFFVQTNLHVGNDCLISSDVSMVGHDHHLNHPNFTAYWSGRRPPSTVILEGDNFIGYRATLVGNIRLGKGSLVAAGAVVVKDVPPYTVVAGVPAKVIKNRFNE